MKLNSHLKKIHFDSVRSADYLGILSLFFGLAVFGFAGYQNLQTAKTLTKIKSEISNIQLEVIPKPIKKTTNEDIQSAGILEKIQKQLDYPWEKLFSTLELVHTNNISLMTIQPNMEKKEVLISAEAANTHEMLEYIHALGAQQNIEHVELLSQEIMTSNQKEGIDFLMMVKML
ncbi:MAG: hypothetical protein HOO90_05680 [Methylotenera sp.]|uniref:hypothetical protein n=1 Tax=Methylotenera sp. TaxID=2051956 RepID=UPI0017D1E428|nr:hypothetical protein [Methylotenera sp.]NOU25008.1 hypothetical protein [Methylotenera sp.]